MLDPLTADPSFPVAIDLPKLSQFVFPLPPSLAPPDLLAHFRNASAKLLALISATAQRLEQLKDARPTAFRFEPLRPQRSTRQRIAAERRARALLAELNALELFCNGAREAIARARLIVCSDLLALCDWLIEHPHPVFVNAGFLPEDHQIGRAHV
jgi:hypothetical protein